MKIILDTNVLISYLLENQIVIKMFDILNNSDYSIIADKRLLNEYSIIPKRKKFNFTIDKLCLISDFISRKITICEANGILIKFNPDRQDSKLIELANSQNCDYIITDDKMLLTRAKHLTKTKLLSSTNFYKLLIGQK